MRRVATPTLLIAARPGTHVSPPRQPSHAGMPRAALPSAARAPAAGNRGIPPRIQPPRGARRSVFSLLTGAPRERPPRLHDPTTPASTPRHPVLVAHDPARRAARGQWPTRPATFRRLHGTPLVARAAAFRATAVAAPLGATSPSPVDVFALAAPLGVGPLAAPFGLIALAAGTRGFASPGPVPVDLAPERAPAAVQPGCGTGSLPRRPDPTAVGAARAAGTRSRHHGLPARYRLPPFRRRDHATDRRCGASRQPAPRRRRRHRPPQRELDRLAIPTRPGRRTPVAGCHRCDAPRHQPAPLAR